MEVKVTDVVVTTCTVEHKGFTFTVDTLNRVKPIKSKLPKGFTWTKENRYALEQARLEVKAYIETK